VAWLEIDREPIRRALVRIAFIVIRKRSLTPGAKPAPSFPPPLPEQQGAVLIRGDRMHD